MITLAQFKDAASVFDRVFLSLRKERPEEILTPYAVLEALGSGPGSKIAKDEICELALPLLLDGGKNYLVSVELRNSISGYGDDPRLVRDKFAVLAETSFVSYLKKDLPEGYGFVTYPAYMLIESRDFVLRFPGDARRYFEYAYPVIYEAKGLHGNADGRPVPGWIAFFFVKPDTMRDDAEMVRRKTLEAVSAVEKLNGRLVGLGGLSASFTDGGRYLEGKTKAGITTGHGYTIANIMNTAAEAARAKRLDLKDAVVAVVGAAGSVGSGVARMCASLGVKEIILIDHRDVGHTIEEIRKTAKVPASAGTVGKDLRCARIVFVATSSPDLILNAGDFGKGAIVLDDSQPKNVPKKILLERPDIMLLEAGAVKAPAGCRLRVKRAFGPALKAFHWNVANIPMAGDDEVPSCLAEVMIWTALGERRPSYSIGRSDPRLAEYLDAKGKTLGFGPAPLQAFGALLSS